ncbi:inositol polyphosphate-4-phosphatase type I A-like [Tubulanus polymorphus]|uniref:inositol polyphosphate-4-phosphatase type I A-like n=1 Tax=Tubulanus polymorphus TaxID=672921 RepID=UPI003DA4A9DB
MKFNARELTFLSRYSKASSFDREGVLLVKDKPEGLFKKSEVYTSRFCRLRGNLLFYFKSKEPSSEPAGVIVLERCTVELDLKEELAFSFQIVFEGDERIQFLATDTEEERDDWIKALHLASYECLKMQLQSLREQIKSKTGRDPVDEPEPTSLDAGPIGIHSDEPVIELGISCSLLPCSIPGQEPNAMVTVSHMTPPEESWVLLAHTEVIEKNRDPNFLKTICINWKTITKSTRIKLAIYDVRERITETMTQVGSVIFTVADLLNEATHQLSLHLGSPEIFSAAAAVDDDDCGMVTVTAWQEDGISALLDGVDSADIVSSPEDEEIFTDTPPPVPLRRSHTRERTKSLRSLCDNISTRAYRFPCANGSKMKVYEFMGESKLTFRIPKELLKLWISEERIKMEQYQELGKLSAEWEAVRKQMLDYHIGILSAYTKSLRVMEEYRGPPFKQSVQKSISELAFVPTNLHLQRMWVHNEARKNNTYYDIVTVGAFIDFPRMFKQGGVRRMLIQLREQHVEKFADPPTIAKNLELQTNIRELQRSIHHYCDGVSNAAVQGYSDLFRSSTDQLSDQVRQFLLVSEIPLLEKAVADYIVELQKTAEIPQEHWGVTRANLEASIICTISKVDSLIKHHADKSSSWFEEVHKLVTQTKGLAEFMCKRALSALVFHSIVQHSVNVQLSYIIKYRRDVNLAQAITTVTAGFVTKLQENIADTAFLRQIAHIGILAHFEALLSCHGKELGMLEDMCIAVNDLSNVKFRLIHQMGHTRTTPRITRSRSGLIIEIPLMNSLFQQVPSEIRQGHLIQIVPVMFNIGINEQATLAEKFGDNSLQELINIESLKVISNYFDQFIDVSGEPVMLHSNGPSLSELMRMLHINVPARKSKNVEILQIAEVASRLMKGMRFTSCKSAKDRTAMGVTLEQVSVLQREHQLDSTIFIGALECMRSEGVRRENTYKNTGSRKYAFNSLRVLSLPKIYRPPAGTYGNVQT